MFTLIKKHLRSKVKKFQYTSPWELVDGDPLYDICVNHLKFEIIATWADTVEDSIEFIRTVHDDIYLSLMERREVTSVVISLV